jgi:hypothetical protein
LFSGAEDGPGDHGACRGVKEDVAYGCALGPFECVRGPKAAAVGFSADDPGQGRGGGQGACLGPGDEDQRGDGAQVQEVLGNGDWLSATGRRVRSVGGQEGIDTSLEGQKLVSGAGVTGDRGTVRAVRQVSAAYRPALAARFPVDGSAALRGVKIFLGGVLDDARSRCLCGMLAAGAVPLEESSVLDTGEGDAKVPAPLPRTAEQDPENAVVRGQPGSTGLIPGDRLSVSRRVSAPGIAGGCGVAAGLPSFSTCAQVSCPRGRVEWAVSDVGVRAARRTSPTRRPARASSWADGASAAWLCLRFGPGRV